MPELAYGKVGPGGGAALKAVPGDPRRSGRLFGWDFEEFQGRVQRVRNGEDDGIA